MKENVLSLKEKATTQPWF